MTAGSCFAQHVGRALQAANYTVIDEEPPPPGTPDSIAQRFGYRLYSARYGNIYSMRQLKQLLLEAAGEFAPSEAVWTKNDRFFDALRPNIEPDGFESETLVAEARRHHLDAVNRAVAQADILIFTLGLTEVWEHCASGTVYPTAPGTIAGSISDAFRFRNLRHSEVRADFEAVRSLMRRAKPDIRFLLTVSPVPLTATASGDHVLAATAYSKSVLRAVAGELREDFPDVDYFPSYEIVTAPISGGRMYETNFRSVRARAVSEIMQCFRAATEGSEDTTAMQQRSGRTAAAVADPSRAARKQRRSARWAAARATASAEPARSEEDVICEDVLLDAFAKE